MKIENKKANGYFGTGTFHFSGTLQTGYFEIIQVICRFIT